MYQVLPHELNINQKLVENQKKRQNNAEKCIQFICIYLVFYFEKVLFSLCYENSYVYVNDFYFQQFNKMFDYFLRKKSIFKLCDANCIFLYEKVFK